MIFYIVYSNIIWACVIAAIIGAGTATLVFLLKGNKGGGDGEFAPKNALEAGLRANAENFAGMYEAMFSVSCGKVGRKVDVFDMWSNAVAATRDAAFVEAFNKKCGKYTQWKPKNNKKFIKAAKKLVKAFFRSGIPQPRNIILPATASSLPTRTTRFSLHTGSSATSSSKKALSSKQISCSNCFSI